MTLQSTRTFGTWYGPTCSSLFIWISISDDIITGSLKCFADSIDLCRALHMFLGLYYWIRWQATLDGLMSICTRKMWITLWTYTLSRGLFSTFQIWSAGWWLRWSAHGAKWQNVSCRAWVVTSVLAVASCIFAYRIIHWRYVSLISRVSLVEWYGLHSLEWCTASKLCFSRSPWVHVLLQFGILLGTLIWQFEFLLAIFDNQQVQ